MFNKFFTLTSMLVASTVLVKATVMPSEPGPGAKYTAGQTCTIAWAGDRDSDTLWKDMSIQLMTGDNWNMIHLTTVATGIDGTISGRFTYECPDVNPYSAVYFYQFSSPLSEEKTWATRFTITSPDGDEVEPENELETDDGTIVLWGVGALADPSTATPPPIIGGVRPDFVAPVNNAAADDADEESDVVSASESDSEPEGDSETESLESAAASSAEFTGSPSAGSVAASAAARTSASASGSAAAGATTEAAAGAGAAAADDSAAISPLANFKVIAALSAVSLAFLA